MRHALMIVVLWSLGVPSLVAAQPAVTLETGGTDPQLVACFGGYERQCVPVSSLNIPITLPVFIGDELLAAPVVIKPFKARDYWWLDALIALSGVCAVADLTSTTFGLGKGNVVEGNQGLAWAAHDPGLLTAVKGTLDAGIIWFMVKKHKQHPKKIGWLAAGSAIKSCGVANYNARAIGYR